MELIVNDPACNEVKQSLAKYDGMSRYYQGYKEIIDDEQNI